MHKRVIYNRKASKQNSTLLETLKHKETVFMRTRMTVHLQLTDNTKKENNREIHR